MSSIINTLPAIEPITSFDLLELKQVLSNLIDAMPEGTTNATLNWSKGNNTYNLGIFENGTSSLSITFSKFPKANSQL